MKFVLFFFNTFSYTVTIYRNISGLGLMPDLISSLIVLYGLLKLKAACDILDLFEQFLELH